MTSNNALYLFDWTGLEYGVQVTHMRQKSPDQYAYKVISGLNRLSGLPFWFAYNKVVMNQPDDTEKLKKDLLLLPKLQPMALVLNNDLQGVTEEGKTYRHIIHTCGKQTDQEVVAFKSSFAMMAMQHMIYQTEQVPKPAVLFF